MANEGFVVDSLSGTIAHEIGHLLGLRHVNDVNGGAGAGTIQDPDFTIPESDANLMWAEFTGPPFDDDEDLVSNFNLTQAQIDAAIYNGLRLDPDGNGTGVLRLTAVPEPTSMAMFGIACLGLTRRRRVAKVSLPRSMFRQSADLRWVVAVFAEGVAAADSPKAFAASANRAVFIDRKNKVGAACWCKATVASQKWADADLVHSHDADHAIGGNSNQPLNDRTHVGLSRSSFLSSRWASLPIER